MQLNLQLDAGVKVANIAKLVGNSPATIHQYYESARRDSARPVEL
jgi:predicted transcriptional regulator